MSDMPFLLVVVVVWAALAIGYGLGRRSRP